MARVGVKVWLALGLGQDQGKKVTLTQTLSLTSQNEILFTV